MLFADKTTLGGVKLEWPEEVVGLLEVGTDGGDLVDEVFHTVDTVGTERLRDDLVITETDSLLVDLTEATLVEELPDSSDRRVTEGNEGSYETEHLHEGAVDLEEDTSMDMSQSEELQDLLLLGGKLVNTDKSDDKDELCFRFHEEVLVRLGLTTKEGKLLLRALVLLVISQSTHLKSVTLATSNGNGSLDCSSLSSGKLLLSSGLSLNRLRYSSASRDDVLLDEVTVCHSFRLKALFFRKFSDNYPLHVSKLNKFVFAAITTRTSA